MKNLQLQGLSSILLLCAASIDGFAIPQQRNGSSIKSCNHIISSNSLSSQSHHQRTKQNYSMIHIFNLSTDPNNNEQHFNGGAFNINVNEAKSILLQLWILPLLSLLSGISPAIHIVAESHPSRMPDCPIAHDIDTLLLWPAVGASANSAGTEGLPPTVFRTPVAALTDSSLYDVDWGLVWTTYFSQVLVSMGISFVMAMALVLFLSENSNYGDNDIVGGVDKRDDQQ